MTFEGKRRSFGAPSSTRPPLRGPKGDKGNPGAQGPAGADGVLSRGVYHIDDYGAVAREYHNLVTITNAERTANVIAINAALEAARVVRDDTGATPKFGGTVYMGPGVYYTNDAVGYDLAEDVNLGVTVQGLGPFPTQISSNNTSREVFKLYTTVGNVRMFFMKDLALYGGRTGLSLVRATYNRFENVWFAGSAQFGLSDYLGSANVFDRCYTTDTSEPGGGTGGAAFFFGSADVMTNCTFGEGGGGVVVIGGGLQIDGGYGYGSFFRDTPNYTDYWTTPGSPANVSLAYFAGEPAAFIGSNCDFHISNLRFTTAKQFLLSSGCQNICLNGVQLFGGDSTIGSPTLFEGFINCMDSFGATALSISGGQFIWNAGTTGYFIKETAAVLHDSVIQTQLIDNTTATITALSSSAPALLNPGGENNLVTLRTFAR
jgi:hypothetical protein